MLEWLVAPPGGDLLTSQSLLVQQVRQWAGQAGTPLALLLASALLGSLLAWSRRHAARAAPALPLPPTPGTALPFLGHLHLLDRGGDPRVTFTRMRNKLGDIFCFYAGSRLIVVLSGYDIIREALVKKAAVFSHRAHTFMSQQMGQGRGIVNTSGGHWREQRKFAERALKTQLSLGQCSGLSHKLQQEVDCLMERLERACCQGQPLDPRRLLFMSYANVIISVIYGHRFDMDDPKFNAVMTALTNCFENFGNTEPLNFFPLVRYIPGDPYRYWFCVKNMNDLENTLVYPELMEHEQMLEKEVGSDDVTTAASPEVPNDEDKLLEKEEKVCDDTCPKKTEQEQKRRKAESDDVITAYLHEMTQKQTTGTPTSMDKDNLVKLAGDLLAGGVEPPSTTNIWVLLYMIRFPQVQEKCYQELLEVVGTSRSPCPADRAHLAYLEATIMEVQRHADVGPFAMAHGLARDTQLRGFHLPKDAIVLVNIHSVHHDVKAWGDPEVFRPERFLGEDGRVQSSENFVPYSMGPRVCPGANMARQEMFLYTASILQRYRLSHPGTAPPSLEGKMCLLHTPPAFTLSLERRQ